MAHVRAIHRYYPVVSNDLPRLSRSPAFLNTCHFASDLTVIDVSVVVGQTHAKLAARWKHHLELEPIRFTLFALLVFNASSLHSGSLGRNAGSVRFSFHLRSNTGSLYGLGHLSNTSSFCHRCHISSNASSFLCFCFMGSVRFLSSDARRLCFSRLFSSDARSLRSLGFFRNTSSLRHRSSNFRNARSFVLLLAPETQRYRFA